MQRAPAKHQGIDVAHGVRCPLLVMQYTVRSTECVAKEPSFLVRIIVFSTLSLLSIRCPEYCVRHDRRYLYGVLCTFVLIAYHTDTQVRYLTCILPYLCSGHFFIHDSCTEYVVPSVSTLRFAEHTGTTRIQDQRANLFFPLSFCAWPTRHIVD
jgi:hypothetical protein